MITYLLTLFITVGGHTQPVDPTKYAEIRHYQDKLSCDRGGFQVTDDLNEEGKVYSWSCTVEGRDL